MSSNTAFIFVEGFFPDRYVYSEMLDQHSTLSTMHYQLVTAGEVVGKDSGGKKALLSFFDYLRRKQALICDFKGKKMIAVFLLDKDVDDYRRTLRRSEHTIYTETYELENYLFMYGDLAKVGASCSSLEIRRVRKEIGNYDEWCKKAVECWSEWLKLCLYANKLKNCNIQSYGCKSSLINSGTTMSIVNSAQTDYLNKLQKHSGKSKQKFKKSYLKHCKMVDKVLSEGSHDRIFKGKWYINFLISSLGNTSAGRRITAKALGDKIINGLAGSLDYKNQWVNHFTTPIVSLRTKSGI